METHQLVREGVRLTFDLHGPVDGPAVLLLHGFPDSAQVWRRQVPALVEAGYRVVVPDMRGYARTDRPTDVEAYALWRLAGDALAILDECGVARAHVVGHDLGSALAWYLGIVHPDRVDHLVALAVGHPLAFRGVGAAQLQKSWYVFLFQFPGVAETWLADDDFANLRAWLHHPDMDAVVEQFTPPGALTAGISFYRANITPESLVGPPLELPPVQAPVLGVWATSDVALTEQQMTDSARYVAGPWRYERLDGVGHWFPLEAAERLNALLLEFLPGTVG